MKPFTILAIGAGLALSAATGLSPSAQVAAPVAAPVVGQDAAPAVVVADPVIVATYPHDSAAFTQGLLWHDGALYESTGREGQSQIRRLTLTSGLVEASAALPAEQFGEGLALWGDTLVSLTWTDKVVHRWDLATLAPIDTRAFPFEGWGLTEDGTHLIASDGSSTLRFLDPETLEVAREVVVTLGGREVDQLNELEFIDGQIVANVWHTGFLLFIDPASGVVRQVADLRPLAEANRMADPDAVLNGIAWDADGQRLFVTGKLWPRLYEIRLEPREGAEVTAR
ncbi:glutaminyl-peptide cyclotransferase [Erythrobacter arachoides]|uniref:Glutaminyl-peptide cyclotransferase n=1 Tax=Aurantiacibacter arachoides TaxID=1850444 RepID=A0A845A7P6_9SPHN|nr:glutaminyl-peptide cyclotransferase [Aurantiacibacter arachoides]MXO93569.1 glutaminyl-peptide cyclotransferase [Aurantiacibacter arachoides]GGD48360.1 glutamine cyclotransferase [Aurantiacibacter arachoides]